MRRGFLLSEYCVVLIVLTMIGCMTPVVTQYIDDFYWRNFERQIRVLQHRALSYRAGHQNKLIVSGNEIRLDKGIPIKLPVGWRAEKTYELRLKYKSPKSMTIHLYKGEQYKRLVFQVGGGTFDIQD